MTNQTDVDYTYSGDPKYQPPASGIRDTKGREYFPYLPEPGLRKALNLAITLQRPLLLEGEPGCGKTRVASALAYELACRSWGTRPVDAKKTKGPKQPKEWWNFYIWNITSTSRAQDGLYTFDAVGRLRDAQLMGTDPARLHQFLGGDAEALEKRMKDKKEYREFGALGEALREQTYRPVLLIDEIDKADSDFPNDLLLELDELRFTIAETQEDVGPPEAYNKPIILITSNREKPLPEPFLRRCLYYYVPFPQEDALRDIIKARFGERIGQKEDIVNLALKKFDLIHKLLERQPGSRPPGTSELLEFLTALIQENRKVEDTLAELENLAEELPLLGTLIKTKADQDLFKASQKAMKDNG
ncbi:MoxR family ATPase [Leptolyngbya sp. PL-A3]|uniref:AAA family ATPase n=1 Tax=Leptolyngbya sp. PL-A3 TaxID=2933911 RepID=UPI0032970F84